MTDGAAVFLVLGAALSWGIAQTVTKLGLSRMDTVCFATLRAILGLLLVVPYGFLTGAFRFGTTWLIGVAAFAGLIDSFLGTLLYMYALKRGEAHRAAALANTAPFWGVATAVLFLGEPARPTIFLAAVLVVAGTYFLVSPKDEGQGPRSPLAGMAALGTAILWGIAETGPAKYCLDRGMAPVEFQVVLAGTAAAAWGLVAIFRRRLDIHPSGIRIAAFTAFTGFFLGWMLWLSGLKLAQASLLTPIRGGAMTISAFLISVLFLGERPSQRAWLGALLACGGVVLATISA
ncbi:TPA: hypothetical protein DCL37_04130 [Candidatus Acetothermia bacterium]|nr:hypothetical protein [Candidatus Acetothermia bacterium]